MSEFTNNQELRIKELTKLFFAILEKKEAVKTIKNSQEIIEHCIPSDIIYLVDELVKSNIPIEELKTGINKFLNVMSTSIKNHPYNPPKANSYLDCCTQNNVILDEKLKALRPSIRELNNSPDDKQLKESIKNDVEILLTFEKYFIIKENVLFPMLENHWENFRCLGVMWAFHDDIRNNLKKLIALLSDNRFEIKDFNKLIGDVFFNMYAIKFREERILFPYMMETIDAEKIDDLFAESLAIGFPFYTPKDLESKQKTVTQIDNNTIDLKTGNLSVDQIVLLFNHLPVDITFVDEHNKVKFFSTPKKRIFPRTVSIIGRDVHNCHPPKSVHIVEKIVEAFKNGSKDKASFWINMNNEMILIQYFSIRDESNNYKGVVEVSQEISEIQSLEGENKLLDWEK